MKKVFLTLCHTTGIGLLGGLVFGLAKSIMVVREAERLAAATPSSAASIKCSAGNVAIWLPIVGIVVGALFGLAMGGLLLLLSRVFRRQRLP